MLFFQPQGAFAGHILRMDESREELALHSRRGLSVHVKESALSPYHRYRVLGGSRLPSTSRPRRAQLPRPAPLPDGARGRCLFHCQGCSTACPAQRPPPQASGVCSTPQGWGHPPRGLANVLFTPASKPGPKCLHNPAPAPKCLRDPPLDPKCLSNQSRRQACKGKIRAGKKPRELTVPVGLRRIKGYPVGEANSRAGLQITEEGVSGGT